MQFGNYTPTSSDNGNGLNAANERYLFDFDNGYSASVVKINEDILSDAPAGVYAADEVGTWELAVVINGVPLGLLILAFGADLTDPLGGQSTDENFTVRWGLSDDEVAPLLAQIESAACLEAA